MGMAIHYPAMTIAKWFVAFGEIEEGDVSNLKLQKLLYYAQGEWLREQESPLFDEPIEAWSHGPVVSNVYHEFKGCGSSALALANDDSWTWNVVDEETTQFLIDVWERYGSLAAWRLREMTHRNGPWRDYFEDGALNVEIPVDAIAAYFRARS
jgi:uncharacterized phage-associated protein